MQVYSHERMLAIAKQGMAKDDEPFAEEVQLPPSTRRDTSAGKPQYFNRIMSGYDWNRYNKTHFEPENPPPKYIQGYRFNVFYPDLQDVTKAPTFKLFECNGDPNSAILRFISGPPYEDVAFKIRNEEWDTDRSHGYKCQFQNGMLQLWVHFKRLRYRR